jgi:hypothetical protein
LTPSCIFLRLSKTLFNLFASASCMRIFGPLRRSKRACSLDIFVQKWSKIWLKITFYAFLTPKNWKTSNFIRFDFFSTKLALKLTIHIIYLTNFDNPALNNTQPNIPSRYFSADLLGFAHYSLFTVNCSRIKSLPAIVVGLFVLNGFESLCEYFAESV